ncbi:MAG TPA: copper resistance protein CopC [Actinoplanes sp.]|nr:copper resistance protein CopC [Actinoplanes sp.]
MNVGSRLAVTAAVLAATLAPSAAWAGERATVTSSSPAAGAVVRGAPPVVTLRMVDPVARVTATVTDGCGQPVPNTAQVYGKRVAIRLAVSHIAAQGHGDHTTAGGSWWISWRAVDGKGHTTNGDLPFVVGVPARCSAPAVAAPAPAPGIRPDFLRILYAVAGLGVLLTLARVVTRRKTP